MAETAPLNLYGWPIPDTALTVTPRDAILYALSLGLGLRAEDAPGLRYLYEGARDFAALPAFAIPLADPGFWMRRAPLDLGRVLHLGERVEILRPVPVESALSRRAAVSHVADKGPDRGAVIVAESTLMGPAGPVARVAQTALARGDGGRGGSFGQAPPRLGAAPPDRAPDAVIHRPTLPTQALLYRWNGDLNPLHADPAAARAAGFERPILHGLCTLGIASLAVLEAFCDWAPAIVGIEARFAAPVLPGDRLDCAMWREGRTVVLRATVVGRAAAALDPAVFTLDPEAIP